MGEHYFCDVCRSADPTKKGVTDRSWRIEEDDFVRHLGEHGLIELALYARYVASELYHGSGRYEVEE